MKGMVAKVALMGATFTFDKLYSYTIPSQLNVQCGCRVLIPFGRGNTKKQGMVFDITEEATDGLKSIISLIDTEPVLTHEGIKLCEYMRETVFCTYYDAVNVMLPSGITHKLIDYYSANDEFAYSLLKEDERQVYDYLTKKGETSEKDIISTLEVERELLLTLCEKEALIKNSDLKQKMSDATQKWVRLSDDFNSVKLTARQKEIVDLLLDIECASVKELRYFTGVSVSVIENLISKGVLIPFEKQIFRKPYKLSSNANKKDIIRFYFVFYAVFI